MDTSLLRRISDYCWEAPKQGAMRVPGRLFGSSGLIRDLEDMVLDQVSGVAALPGIVGASLAMPDAHWGYGFPIGGVAAFDPERGGVISVGGVGYDISCGVRTLRTGLDRETVASALPELVDTLAVAVPAGVGRGGDLRLSRAELDDVLRQGARWAVARGYGNKGDLECIEDSGCMAGADPKVVSETAKKRQQDQMGTLGSGNHYLEVQYVDAVYDQNAAATFGLRQGEVVVSLHCGSRALGHQIGTDFIQILGRAAQKQGLHLPSRDLVCAPIDSKEGREYYQAMACGVNCALANRQVLGHLVRQAFAEVFPTAVLDLLYDVSHNTCKVEEHAVGGRRKNLYVHRKGATRSFGPGRMEVPAAYRQVGQPVLIGGTMGTASYVLAGTAASEHLAWGSACHGAGRAMSRKQATKRWKGKSVLHELEHQGILVRAASQRGAAEEAPGAYKDVSEVVESTHNADLARKVVRLRPMAC
ncbi:MAG: RtcB family protein, partial [Thermodesulfobacteriota bacterium]